LVAINAAELEIPAAFVEIPVAFVEMPEVFVEIPEVFVEMSLDSELSSPESPVTSAIAMAAAAALSLVQLAVFVQTAEAITSSAFDGVKVAPVNR